MEECGRTLVASPLFASAVVGASALLLGGSSAQQVALLPKIAAGELTLALALEEYHHHRPTRIATTAVREGDDFLLNGSKTFVVDGHSADLLIVVARSAGEESGPEGLSLFLVERKLAGVSCRRTLMADSRKCRRPAAGQCPRGRSPDARREGNGWAILAPVLDRGQVAIAAEMMGCALEAFERTVAYLKERRQFGAPIGSFRPCNTAPHRCRQTSSCVARCCSRPSASLTKSPGNYRYWRAWPRQN